MSVGVGAGADESPWREFARWRTGLEYAMSGGLWLHRHTWKGHRMAHLVSADRNALERVGVGLGLHPARLQFRPLKDPRSGRRLPAWHWDLVGAWVPDPVPARSRHLVEGAAE